MRVRSAESPVPPSNLVRYGANLRAGLARTGPRRIGGRGEGREPTEPPEPTAVARAAHALARRRGRHRGRLSGRRDRRHRPGLLGVPPQAHQVGAVPRRDRRRSATAGAPGRPSGSSPTPCRTPPSRAASSTRSGSAIAPRPAAGPASIPAPAAVLRRSRLPCPAAGHLRRPAPGRRLHGRHRRRRPTSTPRAGQERPSCRADPTVARCLPARAGLPARP